MLIATWNVNGIRARFAELVEWVADASPDIFCLQEIKAAESQVPGGLFDLADYRGVWHGDYGGYSGVSIHVRRDRCAEPRFSIPEFDRETRLLEVDLGNLIVCCAYLPNGQKSDSAYQGKLSFLNAMVGHAKARCSEATSFVLVGDMNVAREERDVHPRLRDPSQIGQRMEERELFARLLEEGGLVDAGRTVDPRNDDLFTWWPPWREEKAKNRGWRLDYCLVSRDLAGRIAACRVLRDTGSSDHAPVMLELAPLGALP